MTTNDKLWTQCRKVACWLLEHGSITPREAMNEFKIWRLGGRIHDLRAAVGSGVIETIYESHEGGRHARYKLINEMALSCWVAEQEHAHAVRNRG